MCLFHMPRGVTARHVLSVIWFDRGSFVCMRESDSRTALARTAQRRQVPFSVQHFFLSALHLPTITAIVTVCVQQYGRFPT